MLHKHQCEDCLHVFEHEVPNTKGMSREEGEKAYADGHKCPHCNAGPWFDIHFSSKAEMREYDRQKLEEFIDFALDRLFGDETAV